MKMTEKTKRNLAIGGGAVICIALIAAIGLQFGKAPAGEDVLPVDTPPASEVVVDSGEAATGKTEEKELVIETGSKETEPETDSTKPVDIRPAQTDQSIQPEVTKPAEPEETVKTDPTQKPDGTKVETPPAPVEHDEVVAPPANRNPRPMSRRPVTHRTARSTFRDLAGRRTTVAAAPARQPMICTKTAIKSALWIKAEQKMREASWEHGAFFRERRFP